MRRRKRRDRDREFRLRLAIAMGVTVALFLIPRPAAAVEEGLSQWLKGYTGFMSGALPPVPAFYNTPYLYYFEGSVGREERNGLVETNAHVSLEAGMFEETYVTNLKFLGGQYAVGALVGWGGANFKASVSTPITPITPNGGGSRSFSNNSIADSIFTPAILGWHSGPFNWLVAANFYVPTGNYDLRQVNIGRNVWGFVPQISITYFDPHSGWDVSTSLFFVTTSENDASHYQSGDIFQMDWAVGKHFGMAGEWEAGIAGNYVDQVSGDSGSGARLGSFEAESAGVGPSVNYTTKLGRLPAVLSAKWEHDFSGENTFKGNLVTASATVIF